MFSTGQRVLPYIEGTSRKEFLKEIAQVDGAFAQSNCHYNGHYAVICCMHYAVTLLHSVSKILFKNTSGQLADKLLADLQDIL